MERFRNDCIVIVNFGSHIPIVCKKILGRLIYLIIFIINIEVALNIYKLSLLPQLLSGE